MWQLKKNQPPFELVDGPMAGRQFVHGRDYEAIPDNYRSRFEHSGERIIKAAEPTAAETPPTRKTKLDKQEGTDA